MARAILVCLLALGCGEAPEDEVDGGAPDTTPPDAARRDTGTPDAAPPLRLRAVTFNTGSGPEMAHDRAPDDGYTSAEAEITDTWYGNGLAWKPLVEDTRRFFAAIDPDLVVFQEIFHPGDCPGIPAEALRGFVCEDWTPDMPTVVQQVLGADWSHWQVACHPGKPDKCAAVHRRLGTFRGCDADLCLEGLAGHAIEGCGRGARVARGVIDLTRGGTLTVVNLHGSSGLTTEDIDCRLRQIDQVFIDLGDGRPAADGERNLVLGDLNTDPGRLLRVDRSAARWLDFAGEDGTFHFLTEVGPDATPTYARGFNIDHALSDTLTGTCRAAGVHPDLPAVTETVFFDHRPIVCDVGE